MLDVGWTELLVIAVVLIVVVGPKDLPPMLRTFGKMMTRLRAVAGDFRSQFDAALREADLDDVRKSIGDAQKLNPMNSLREAINPLRQTANEIKADLQRSTTVDTPAVTVADAPVDSIEAAVPLAEKLPVVADAEVAPVADAVMALDTAAVSLSKPTAMVAAPVIPAALPVIPTAAPVLPVAVPVAAADVAQAKVPAEVVVAAKAARKPRQKTVTLDDAGLPITAVGKPTRAKAVAADGGVTVEKKAATPKKTKKDTA